MVKKGKVGRPIGFRLSEASKRAISEAKRGQKHKQETRDKISRSLIVYFRQQSPLSDEIANTYCRCDDDDLCDWVNNVREELDSDEDILTSKALHNKNKIEMVSGVNIEFFSHEMTPEVLLLVKEHCELKGLDVYTFIDQCFSEEDD